MSMKSLAVTATFLLLTSNANAAVINGGFESGLTGWSCTGADLCSTSPGGYIGNAVNGYDNSGFATLSQTISTIGGELYDFSFWSKAYSLAAGNILRYSINSGAAVTVDTTTEFSLTTDTFVAAGASTLLEFFFETDSGTGTWYIDEVAVETSAVPVPAAVWLFGSGLLGLVGIARRKVA